MLATYSQTANAINRFKKLSRIKVGRSLWSNSEDAIKAYEPSYPSSLAFAKSLEEFRYRPLKQANIYQ